MPIRLLAVTHSATLGGNQLHMADLLQAFSPSDVSVVGVLVPESGSFSQLLDRSGLPAMILPFPILSRLNSPRAVIRQLAKLPHFARRFETILREVRPDIVYASSHRSAIVIEPFLTRCQMPMVWSTSEFIKSQPWHRLAIRRITRQASAIVAISHSTRKAILRLGAKPELVQTIPIGIDLRDFDIPLARMAKFRADESISSGSLLVAMVGWIQPLKGWHVLVEAIPLVREAFPNARFLFVGDCLDDRYRSYHLKLRMRIGELAQEDAVIWLGYRHDVPVILSACDIVIQASVEPETLGVTALQAMSARKPVICSNIGALPEVNVDGETGLVVSPSQPLELAEAIKVLLSNVDMRIRMGVRGRDRVLERFTRQHQVQAHVSLFQDIDMRRRQHG